MKQWLQRAHALKNLFDKEVKLEIHFYKTEEGQVDLIRYSPQIWLECQKIILFDFPKDFIVWRNSQDYNSVLASDYDHQLIAELVDRYIQTPEQTLLNAEFEEDLWGFTDLLKVADRRLAPSGLMEKFGSFPVENALGALLQLRLNQTHLSKIAKPKTKFIHLPPDKTGLPFFIRLKSLPRILDTWETSELPCLRIFPDPKKLEDQFFAVSISDQPKVIEQHKLWRISTNFPSTKMAALQRWILLNKPLLMEFWQHGHTWDPLCREEMVKRLVRFD